MPRNGMMPKPCSTPETTPYRNTAMSTMAGRTSTYGVTARLRRRALRRPAALRGLFDRVLSTALRCPFDRRKSRPARLPAAGGGRNAGRNDGLLSHRPQRRARVAVALGRVRYFAYCSAICPALRRATAVSSIGIPPGRRPRPRGGSRSSSRGIWVDAEGHRFGNGRRARSSGSLAHVEHRACWAEVLVELVELHLGRDDLVDGDERRRLVRRVGGDGHEVGVAHRARVEEERAGGLGQRAGARRAPRGAP